MTPATLADMFLSRTVANNSASNTTTNYLFNSSRTFAYCPDPLGAQATRGLSDAPKLFSPSSSQDPLANLVTDLAAPLKNQHHHGLRRTQSAIFDHTAARPRPAPLTLASSSASTTTTLSATAGPVTISTARPRRADSGTFTDMPTSPLAAKQKTVARRATTSPLCTRSDSTSDTEQNKDTHPAGLLVALASPPPSSDGHSRGIVTADGWPVSVVGAVGKLVGAMGAMGAAVATAGMAGVQATTDKMGEKELDKGGDVELLRQVARLESQTHKLKKKNKQLQKDVEERDQVIQELVDHINQLADSLPELIMEPPTLLDLDILSNCKSEPGSYDSGFHQDFSDQYHDHDHDHDLTASHNGFDSDDETERPYSPTLSDATAVGPYQAGVGLGSLSSLLFDPLNKHRSMSSISSLSSILDPADKRKSTDSSLASISSILLEPADKQKSAFVVTRGRADDRLALTIKRANIDLEMAKEVAKEAAVAAQKEPAPADPDDDMYKKLVGMLGVMITEAEEALASKAVLEKEDEMLGFLHAR